MTAKRIDKKEALELLGKGDLLDLGERADKIRQGLHPEEVVTFIVDRNINYTNVCLNKCRFCAFYRDRSAPDAYVLTKDQLFDKIVETIDQGGTQILIQGGLHPDLDIHYYVDMLRSIKKRFDIDVHGFSPPEITYIAERSDLTVRETLEVLGEAGLDSVPGGGAEILSDRVREQLSPKKIRTAEWLKVMEEAHGLGMRTTATMMFGSVETEMDIIEHLDAIRGLQDRTGGFTAFIPWSFQSLNTEIAKSAGKKSRSKGSFDQSTGVDYLKILAVSRIYLDNIRNLQASWVTQGLKMAQVALRFGANDFGSTMIEENVVRAAGVSYRVTKEDIIEAIRASGFSPAQRNTKYHIIKRF
ncbi:MAG: dehypoxanthine futalosine cyclase [Nitrospirota bacterium]|nr:MAG: dehypoxanthine futalosine cyclase [Nitrospirota bacterium]